MASAPFLLMPFLAVLIGVLIALPFVLRRRRRMMDIPAVAAWHRTARTLRRQEQFQLYVATALGRSVGDARLARLAVQHGEAAVAGQEIMFGRWFRLFWAVFGLVVLLKGILALLERAWIRGRLGLLLALLIALTGCCWDWGRGACQPIHRTKSRTHRR